MKRWSGRTKPVPSKRSEASYKPVTRGSRGDESASSESKCLIRASLGSRKISTVVAAKDMNRFQLVSRRVMSASSPDSLRRQAYSNLLKGNLHGLKKKDRKKEAKGATSGSRATQ